mmetsp:Transcript_10126/g.11547  ORF Transcript_10126/g.11547 Transcript_10126/m.11547 type:complete len:109 (+) Transcript_10126:17-343(+)
MSAKASEVPHKGGFLTGVCLSILLNVASRRMNGTRLSYHPLGYLYMGLGMGTVLWYFNYQRRCLLEKILYTEDQESFNNYLKVLNNTRIGEESTDSNLTNFIVTHTLR